jgi:hypothetical protein
VPGAGLFSELQIALTHLRHRSDPAAQQSPAVLRCAIFSVRSTGGTASETPRVHHASRRHGSGVATRGARAARYSGGRSRNATMNPPINAWSCVRRSRNHCNLSGIYSPQCSEHYEECIGAKKHLVLGLLSHTAPPTVKLICHWIIGTTVEAIIRRRCCHVGRNSFISRWQIVISIRQHCSLHWLTVLSITTEMSRPITEIAVYIVS